MSSVSSLGSAGYYASLEQQQTSISSSTNLSIESNSLSSSAALSLANPVDQIQFSSSALEKLKGASQEPADSDSSSTPSTGSDSFSDLQALLTKIYSS